jgi:3-phosphoshikimate 1-carboxyvinyltransferase
MKVRIIGGPVSGVVRAPPSKSYTQRAVLCALLADGESEIVDPSLSEDGLSALRAAGQLGAKITEREASWSLSGGNVTTPEDVINCGGSATVLRLFTAAAALAPGSSVLTGNDSLRRRPMGELLAAMNSIGAACFSTRHNGLPPVVVVGNGIEGGEARMKGDVSSQFISALLFASTQGRGITKILLTSPLESRHYVEMSLHTLQVFGGEVRWDLDRGIFSITGGQVLQPRRYRVEGDYSSASYLLAAGLLGGKVEICNLAARSLQGDSVVLGIFASMGGSIIPLQDSVVASASASKLHGIEIDARDIPDLIPILAVVASQADGLTVISHVGRLRLKESDRIKMTVDTLRAMGAEIVSSGDTITVRGRTKLSGARIDPAGDHRIAMACAVASLAAAGDTIIEDAECVSKSYPSFFDDLTRLGARVEVEP